jgi:hypothetical protein
MRKLSRFDRDEYQVKARVTIFSALVKAAVFLCFSQFAKKKLGIF